MKTVEIIGFKRANLGKKESADLRLEAQVPCVLYGNGEQVHFYAPMILFRDLVYTPEARMVDLNIEGTIYHAILQDIQFHSINDIILHADFLQLKDDREIKMDIPVKFIGTAPGVMKGGKMYVKLRKLAIKALPKNMPDEIEVDITALDLGKSVRVSEVKAKNFVVTNNPLNSIATIEVPRALRGAAGEEEAKK
jgi:large subunit ribosomal protein L25